MHVVLVASLIQIATFQENMDSPAMIDQSMYASAVDSVEKLKLDEDAGSRNSPQVRTIVISGS